MPSWTTRTDDDSPGASAARLTLIMVADVPAADVAAFQHYEAEVLPLLERHGGWLERRLRSGDQTFEAHMISFADEVGYSAYLADPDRVGARRILAGHPIGRRVVVVHDVPGRRPSEQPEADAGRWTAADLGSEIQEGERR